MNTAAIWAIIYSWLPTVKTAIGPSLIGLKITFGLGLIYYGTATRKAFAVVFGSAVLLIASAYFLDVKQPVSHEADIVVSLAVSVLFAFSIFLLTGAFNSQPLLNVAISVALLSGFYATMAGVHSSTGLYEMFDAATSAFSVLLLGFIVAVRTSKERPLLSLGLALTTMFFSALNADYFKLDTLTDFSNEILGATTVAFVALISWAYVSPNLKGTPPSVFKLKNVFNEIHRAASAGIHASVSFLSLQRPNG
jgi:hypothetical protein